MPLRAILGACVNSGGPKGEHLKGGHLKRGFRTEIRTRHMDSALKKSHSARQFSLRLSEAIPQGKRRLDRESAVQTEQMPSRPHRALKNAILRCLGLRCSGLGLPQFLIIERGGKTPTPKISALLRKRPVLLRADFVLTKDRKRPYYGYFCGKIHREGSCSKAAGVIVKSRC